MTSNRIISDLCCGLRMVEEFKNYEEILKLAEGARIDARSKDVVRLLTKENIVSLENSLYVSGLQCNFMSAAKAVNSGCRNKFEDKMATIAGKQSLLILRANSIYLLISKK